MSRLVAASITASLLAGHRSESLPSRRDRSSWGNVRSHDPAPGRVRRVAAGR